MNVGTAISGYKWIIDANHNTIPEKAEIAKQAEDIFSVPITEADCAALGITLNEAYGIEDITGIVSAIQAINLEAAGVFQNAVQLYQQKNYSAAKAEFDLATLRYGESVELSTVLIAISQKQTTDVFAGVIQDFIKNKEVSLQNFNTAKTNSASAAQAQYNARFVADDTNLVTRFRSAQELYNKGIQEYNTQKYADAVSTFTLVDAQCKDLLAVLADLEVTYPKENMSSRRTAIEELNTANTQIKALTALKVK